MRIIDINSRDILLDEKIYKNILIYDISIALHIRFIEIDGLIKTYDGIRYLVLFSNSWHDKICDTIKYFISKKSGITDRINHNFGRMRIDSYNSLPTENTQYTILYLLYF